MTARYIVGDVRDVLATLPDSSVDLIFTSPPFLALRSYLPTDHPDKGREIGSEPDPGAFIDTLLGVTEDLARVLAPHGSLCVELGDTYSGSGGAGGDYNADGLREGQPAFEGTAARRRPVKASPDARSHRNMGEGTVAIGGGRGWPEAKSACLIPELYRLSLAYGRNPLTGRETPRWKVRNTIRWCRPNPPVGALGDKFRPATSEIVVACKARDRYFDLDAVRGEVSDWMARYANESFDRKKANARNVEGTDGYEPRGAPPLDWWKIPTHGYPGAHYATFPPALVTIPLLSMCPERVCTTCGKPSRRITGETTYRPDATHSSHALHMRGDPLTDDPHVKQFQPAGANSSCVAERETLGWSDCGHGNQWRRGVILDPFGGSGTVAEVATGHGRDAILIDIDRRNADLASARVGMFLTVEEPVFEVPA